MRQLQKQARREAKAKEKQQQKEAERNSKKNQLKAQKLSKKSLEWKRMQRKFPEKEGYKTLPIHEVHPDFRVRFLNKCVKQGFTMSGKLRGLISDLLTGKIDDIKMQDEIAGTDFLHLFGKLPSGPLSSFTISNIPTSMHAEFYGWCRLRGVSMSFKVKQLMFAFLKDKVE